MSDLGSGPDCNMPSALMKSSLSNNACNPGRSPSPHSAAMEWNLRISGSRFLRTIGVETGGARHPISDSHIVSRRITHVCFSSAKRLLSDPDLVLVRPGGYLRPRRAAPVDGLTIATLAEKILGGPLETFSGFPNSIGVAMRRSGCRQGPAPETGTGSVRCHS